MSSQRLPGCPSEATAPCQAGLPPPTPLPETQADSQADPAVCAHLCGIYLPATQELRDCPRRCSLACSCHASGAWKAPHRAGCISEPAWASGSRAEPFSLLPRLLTARAQFSSPLSWLIKGSFLGTLQLGDCLTVTRVFLRCVCVCVTTGVSESPIPTLEVPLFPAAVRNFTLPLHKVACLGSHPTPCLLQGWWRQCTKTQGPGWILRCSEHLGSCSRYTLPFFRIALISC